LAINPNLRRQGTGNAKPKKQLATTDLIMGLLADKKTTFYNALN